MPKEQFMEGVEGSTDGQNTPASGEDASSSLDDSPPAKVSRQDDDSGETLDGEEAATDALVTTSARLKAKSFITTPIYELRQVGEVKYGPGARSATTGVLGGGALPRLSLEQQETVSRAKKYAMEQSIKMVLMKQTLAHQQQAFQQLATQRTQVQRQQALALMCRVYVGSISFELKEDTIRAAFLPFGPIKSINMSWDPVTQKHKGFAFVEYEIPEGAQLSLEQMNGAMLGGRNIKVGRPSNMPQAQQVIDEIQEEAKSYNRIYIASIHPDLSEEDIKSVFEAFGPIIFCKLSQGPTLHSHKGYGFIEYSIKNAADEAISSMNLFDLGGQLLRVGRSITPPNAAIAPPVAVVPNSTMPTAAAVAAAAATAKIQAMDAVLGISAVQVAAAAGIVPSLLAPVQLKSLPLAAAGLNPLLDASALITPPTTLVTPLTLASQQAQQSSLLLRQTNAAATSIATQQQPTATLLAAVAAQNGTAASGGVTQVGQSLGGTVTAQTAAEMVSQARSDVMKKVQEQQEELQKKLMDEGEPQTLQQQETMSIKGQNARHLVMQRLMRPTESKVLILRNMVGAEDVDEDLQEEIQEECAKFGIVEQVIIYKEKQSEAEDAEIIVKIFVEFEQPGEAIKGRDVLNGRYFGGRLVQAQIYEQALFDHGDLSG